MRGFPADTPRTKPSDAANTDTEDTSASRHEMRTHGVVVTAR
jgi:hypothetical protein